MKGSIRRAFCVASLAAIFCISSVRPAVAQGDPVALVDTFVGTSGGVNTFPGATAPFGMLQWSPDTTSRPPGGGYEFDDSAITGFSLTHLSGPGCGAFGDVPILPAIGPVTDPQHVTQPFAHADEFAAPGYYAVTLGPARIGAELAAATRSGIGRFTFPRTDSADLIFKLDGSQTGDDDETIQRRSSTMIAGSVESGHFCGAPDEYRLYWVAEFDRPFASMSTLIGDQPSSTPGDVEGEDLTSWVTFDARADDAVTMRVAISFVSVASAIKNLRAEQAGWSVDAVKRRTAQLWRSELARVSANGGTDTDERVFYTALYHALLSPNVFSDADGSYAGFDGAVHRAPMGRIEYANFSGWDIYRTQMPLLALVYPREASDMIQSLVDAAKQGGWLPKWPLANGYTDAMNGDSADPIVASAFAMGARSFDASTALQQMVRGAEALGGAPGQGWYVARPDVDEYLKNGYVTNSHANSLSPLPNSASETLEYSLDDFAIARLASAIGDDTTRKRFAARSMNWTNLFDADTGLIAPRDSDGAFFETPMNKNGQSGFQEGNAVQYTWLVPQDLHDLFQAMGGDAAASTKLDAFFTQLNAGPGAPYAWLGNEPSLLQPWLYLSLDEPWKTQALVRKIGSALYTDAPAGESGNDDLGTMAAWYVWSAIGFYPQTPGVPLLDIGSPLFPSTTISTEDGRTISINAPAAGDASPYVQAVRLNGKNWTHSWLTVPANGKVALDIQLGTQPSTTWAAAPGDGPPSWSVGRVKLPPSTTAMLDVSPTSVQLAPSASTTLTVTASNRIGAAPVTVAWRVALPASFVVSPDSGSLAVAPGASSTASVKITADAAIGSGYFDASIGGIADNGAPIHHASVALQVLRPGDVPQIAYVMNFSGASIQPIDMRTHTYGPAVAVDADPGDAALSADGKMLFVANQGSADVSVVDTSALKLVTNIPVGRVPAGIRMTPDGKTAWVSDYGDDDVRPIDSATLKAGAPIAVGHHPEELAITPDGSTLLVVDQGTDDVTVIDLASKSVKKKIPVGRVPLGIVVTPDGRHAYVTDMGSNDVIPIALPDGVAGMPIHVGTAPQQPGISPDGRWLLVPDSGSRAVSAIDLGSSMLPIDTITVGNGPFYVSFSPDGTTAFVVDTGDDECVPIDMATRKVEPPIPTGAFPISVVR